MKSHLTRFLHITSSYSGLTRISRSNKVANFFHLDTPVKPECDTMGTDASLKFDNDKIVNAGRSMVEMLGVLAIIGVLSVGAIAGIKATNSASFTSPVLTDTTINQITKSDIYDYCALCKSGPLCRVSANFKFD